MTNSFSRVPPLRREQIDSYAHQARAFYGQDRQSFLDIITCLRSGRVPTVKGGIKQLVYAVRPNGALVTDEALTCHEKDSVRIETTKRVHDAALFGEGRARFTLTHELGHAILHDGVAMPRSSLQLVKPKWLEDYRSAERQADRFSASALIYKPFIAPKMSIDEIAVEFGVGQAVARIAFEEVDRSASREAAAARVRRIAASLQEQSSTTEAKSYLHCECPQCGLYKLFPIAGKYMCDNCNVVHDAARWRSELKLRWRWLTLIVALRMPEPTNSFF